MSFSIGRHTVDESTPPLIIAEAGVHHYNSVELAKKYLIEAKVAGAHCIKFQTYSAERLVTRWAPTYWDSGDQNRQFDIFSSRSLLSKGDYAALFDLANRLGITLLSTPFDSDSAEMLNSLGMAAFKIASADITNFPLLRTIASFGKPILLSTGASTMEEIRRTVTDLERFDVPLALLHCNLTYPTARADANLSRINLLKTTFPEYLPGYSDHTIPVDSHTACPLAVAFGARIVEKHFTLNTLLPEDDHYHAVDPAGLAKLVRNCNAAWEMSKPAVEMTEGEKAARSFARRSIVAASRLEAGKTLFFSDLDFKRPGTGVSPTEVEQVVGKRLKRSLQADDLVLLEDLEESE